MLLAPVALLLGGLNLTTAAPLFAPRWWAVVLTVIAYLAFVLVALDHGGPFPLLDQDHRSRPTSIGKTVSPRPASTRPGSSRSTGPSGGRVPIGRQAWGPGDPVEVVAVSGIMLEVGPDHAVRE